MSIDRSEYASLFDYLNVKEIKIKNPQEAGPAHLAKNALMDELGGEGDDSDEGSDEDGDYNSDAETSKSGDSDDSGSDESEGENEEEQRKKRKKSEKSEKVKKEPGASVSHLDAFDLCSKIYRVLHVTQKKRRTEDGEGKKKPAKKSKGSDDEGDDEEGGGGGGKKKSTKKKKDKDAPKAALSAYILFSKEERPRVSTIIDIFLLDNVGLVIVVD